MRPFLACSALSLLATFSTGTLASAQDVRPSPAPRPDLRVSLGNATLGKTALPARRNAGAAANALPSLRRGQEQPLRINVFGGVSRFSSPGFVDDACGAFNVFAYIGEFPATCTGNGGGTGINFGGEAGYAYPVGDGLHLVFLGGVDVGTRQTIQLDIEGQEPETGGDFFVTGGYHFRTTNVYGGVGVQVNRIFVGGTFGRLLHTGHNFFEGELTYGGQVLETIDEEEDNNGSAGFFGLRFQFDVNRLIGLRFDYRSSSFAGGNSDPSGEFLSYQLPDMSYRVMNFNLVFTLPIGGR